MLYYLAIDLGASSGRHIVGHMEHGVLQTEEVYRFPNSVQEQDGHLVWDTEALLGHVKAGIAAAKARFGEIRSLAIDTWGVDYVLMKGDRPVLPVYAYRDSRTERSVPEVHAKIPFSQLYRRTGCQFQPFNTIYQLYADRMDGRLEGVTDLLMMPEYLSYRLCGVKASEYTNATTTGLINAASGCFDGDILRTLGLPASIFPPLCSPGTKLGSYEGIDVMLCASHDTASAVEGIPMQGDALYLSSGTWSLLGVKAEKPLTGPESELANFTNEGGVGYTRYQKNIMGMWLLNRLHEELCPGKPWDEIVQEAEESAFDTLVDANAPCFLAPDSMKDAFDAALGAPPAQEADYFRCACRSLAACYGKTVREIETNTGRSYETLYIVGGGAKNGFLNRLTAEATGKTVTAIPMEATAYGNLHIQMEV